MLLDHGDFLLLLLVAKAADHDRRMGGQHLGNTLVVGGEGLFGDLVGEVQVADHLTAGPDGHAQEGGQRRMPDRHPDEICMCADVRQVQRLPVVEHHPQHAAPHRRATG